MAEIKPLSRISAKWKSNSSGSGDSYREGVTSPRRSWQAATSESAERWGQAVVEASSNGRFERGVNEAGDTKWKSNSQTLGPARYKQGVGIAEPEYVKGFGKYHNVIAGVTLPPKGPKGSPENIERVRVLADALHTAKVTG